MAKIAKKYHVSKSTVAKHSRNENWTEARNAARAEVEKKVIQKTAEAAADNAVIAMRIKRKLLIKLEKEIDALPDLIGSESRNTTTEKKGDTINSVTKDKTKVYKLRDLTAAYKDLTDDMAQTDQGGNELLESLLTLERRASDGD